jgi:hypothetical protein
MQVDPAEQKLNRDLFRHGLGRRKAAQKIVCTDEQTKAG